MEDNIFKGRMRRGDTLRTIDQMGITACDGNDPKVRATAPCSDFGTEKKTTTHGVKEPRHKAATGHKTARTTKAKAGVDAAVAYDYSMGGVGDVPPLGKMKEVKPVKPKAVATGKSASASSAKKSGAKTVSKSDAAKTGAKKSAPVSKKKSSDSDDVIMIIEEQVFIKEYF